MTWPFEQRFNVAQYARRVGISEGRARAMLTDLKGSRLAEPDGADADGKPVWFASTIDAWCRATARPVPRQARFPHGWPDAPAPAELIYDEVVSLPDPPGRQAHVLVWDAGDGDGHLLLVNALAGFGIMQHTLAKAAARFVEPLFWSAAVIVIGVPPSVSGDGAGGHWLPTWRIAAPGIEDPGPPPAAATRRAGQPTAALPAPAHRRPGRASGDGGRA
ncbi:hypothetical protein [Dactylosporangium sp. CA-092794]|uniref:hypothetical protein n=1 Tax=Dactylosporangium sp. CA-092794 TaxID=3239929 RepID=UPI003D92B48A